MDKLNSLSLSLSDPPEAEPYAPPGRRTAGGSPLHFMSLPVVDVPHCIEAGARPSEHQDPDRGLPPDFRRLCQTLDDRGQNVL